MQQAYTAHAPTAGRDPIALGGALIDVHTRAVFERVLV